MRFPRSGPQRLAYGRAPAPRNTPAFMCMLIDSANARKPPHHHPQAPLLVYVANDRYLLST